MEQTMPVPFDVKLMNMLATALFLGCGALLVLAGVRWAIHHPALSIARIVVHGELEHNSAVSLQANVMPSLKGNFFTMDLDDNGYSREEVLEGMKDLASDWGVTGLEAF